jgi:uncharacterized Zn finger protein
MWYQFRPYVSVAQRRAKAMREIEKRKRKGQTITPIVLEGRTIAHSFWGKAWCENLESYSDYANRLPRGRTYVRNGSVVDLQIQAGKITALVMGTSLYKIVIDISPVSATHWRSFKGRCAGQIGSLVELLQGRLSQAVMNMVTAHDGGLFPKPREIKLSCSCPDWAGMCKHVAAVLYGVGARLDQQPELLFVLRKVDHLQLIEEALPSMARKPLTGKKTLRDSDVASVFGIELAEPETHQGTPVHTIATDKSGRPAGRTAVSTSRRQRKSAKVSQLEKTKSPPPGSGKNGRLSRRRRQDEVARD